MDKKLEARIARLEKLLSNKKTIKNESFDDFVLDPLVEDVIDIHNQINALNIGRTIRHLDDDNKFALKRHLQDMAADMDAWLTLL